MIFMSNSVLIVMHICYISTDEGWKKTTQVSLQDLENAFFWLVALLMQRKINSFFMDHLYFQASFVSSKFVVSSNSQWRTEADILTNCSPHCNFKSSFVHSLNWNWITFLKLLLCKVQQAMRIIYSISFNMAIVQIITFRTAWMVFDI